MAWKPGQSGNPGGRPKVAEEFRRKARAAVDEHVLAAWVDEVQLKERQVITLDGQVVMVKERGKNWIKASELLAGYGYGKPVQPVAPDPGGEGDDGEQQASFPVTIRIVEEPIVESEPDAPPPTE